MAIASLFERGRYNDWREFSIALRNDREIARDALYISEYHAEKGAAELARVLVRQFYGSDDLGLE